MLSGLIDSLTKFFSQDSFQMLIPIHYKFEIYYFRYNYKSEEKVLQKRKVFIFEWTQFINGFFSMFRQSELHSLTLIC